MKPTTAIRIVLTGVMIAMAYRETGFWTGLNFFSIAIAIEVIVKQIREEKNE